MTREETARRAKVCAKIAEAIGLLQFIGGELHEELPDPTVVSTLALAAAAALAEVNEGFGVTNPRTGQAAASIVPG